MKKITIVEMVKKTKASSNNLRGFSVELSDVKSLSSERKIKFLKDLRREAA